ncbi:MAG: HAD family phosphatase [Firmicutes bacterium]|nr:HAD family phosphatase [Bacillota bacterium]
MKLIVSDFDNTFYSDNYEENIILINEFVNKGNLFVIATGRPFDLLKKDIQNKNIAFEYLICTDGAVVYDKDFNILKLDYMNKLVALKILEELKENKNIEKVYLNIENDFICGVYGLYKDYKKAKQLLEIIKTNYDVDGYLGLHWINIINKNITKIDGIEYVKNKINIKDSDIYTIGDNVNDLTMINKYNGFIISQNNQNNCVKNFKEFMEKINESNIN